tara:strand:+ start:131 stop:289 length:159 start_codon:yes stop_codon:yes gene_type:complete
MPWWLAVGVLVVGEIDDGIFFRGGIKKARKLAIEMPMGIICWRRFCGMDVNE